MKNYLLFIMGVICFSLSSNAQTWLAFRSAYAPPVQKQPPTEIKPLSIGDRVPDIVFHHMLNYKDSTAKLSDFKGMPIILDFFATWCGSCIAALPKLDSLQKQFESQIQIIVVTGQSSNNVNAFLRHNPNVKNISLPFVTSDSILNQYFPHKMIPHEVWIGKNRKAVAITEYYYVTAANLKDFVNARPLHLPLKKDAMRFTTKNPLFYNYRNNNQGLYYSTFGKFIKGVPGLVLKYKKDNDRVKFFATNIPIIGLLQIAIPGLSNRLTLQVKDTSRYIWDRSIPFDQWAADNCFCYEIVVPPGTSKKDLHKYMLQDLNRYLGTKIHREEQKIKCWALVKTNNKPLPPSQGGKPEYNLLNRTIPVKMFRNLPISKLIAVLNYQFPGYPIAPIIIDKTQYTGNIDLELKVDDIHNIPALRKALQPYGLDLTPLKRKLKMFVLTERGFKNDLTY